jgi:hypothetical protein
MRVNSSQDVTIHVNTEKGTLVEVVPHIPPPPPVPQSPAISIQIFHDKGSAAEHPQASVTVPESYKIIGGGARVNFTEPSLPDIFLP